MEILKTLICKMAMESLDRRDLDQAEKLVAMLRYFPMEIK